jgi:hypothetical protein
MKHGMGFIDGDPFDLSGQCIRLYDGSDDKVFVDSVIIKKYSFIGNIKDKIIFMLEKILNKLGFVIVPKEQWDSLNQGTNIWQSKNSDFTYNKARY